MLARLESGFVAANRALIGAMMAVMFVLVFANVVLRYGLGISIAWAEEVSSFLMIWVTYLGAGLALREGRHVAISLFQDMLPAAPRRVLRIVLGLVILGFFATLAYYGVVFSEFGWSQTTAVTQIPRGVPYMAVPIGAVGVCLHLILFFRHYVDQDWEAMEDPETPETGSAAS